MYEKKPLIGVLPLVDTDKESLWMLPGYMQGLEQAGACTVILSLTTDKNIIKQYCDMCDGFLFTGGQDVSPGIYGEDMNAQGIECCEKRDILEGMLLDLALAKNKSVLGICRGIQFINAYLGGTLYRHLPDEHPSDINHHQSPPYDIAVHFADIIKASPLYELLKTEKLGVNSYHHQAVKVLADCLEPMAYSPDGLVEAVYMPSKKYVWAVQWHPEFSFKTDENSRKIFSSFVKSCKAADSQ